VSKGIIIIIISHIDTSRLLPSTATGNFDISNLHLREIGRYTHWLPRIRSPLSNLIILYFYPACVPLKLAINRCCVLYERRGWSGEPEWSPGLVWQCWLCLFPEDGRIHCSTLGDQLMAEKSQREREILFLS
jgi:hypothetical protein